MHAQGILKIGWEFNGKDKKKQPTREWPAVSLG